VSSFASRLRSPWKRWPATSLLDRFGARAFFAVDGALILAGIAGTSLGLIRPFWPPRWPLTAPGRRSAPGPAARASQ
jgi:hypothetical protein